MATMQARRGRRDAKSNLAGDVRAVDSAPNFPLLSPVTQGVDELSLQVMPVLQTTLDAHQLISLFHECARQVVLHDGVTYRYPGNEDGLSIGESGPHTCAYRLMVEGSVLGEIIFSRSLPFSGKETSLLESLICALVYPLRNCLRYKAAMEESRRDALTGIYNRSVLEVTLKREVSLAHRYHTPLSVIFMDIDYFKSVNDSCGHAVGDAVIREFARCVSEKIRATDILSRYGGDEFVAILPNTTLDGAELLATRIREGVEQSVCFANLNHDMKITTSIGIADLNGRQTAQSLLNRADRSLFLAKRAGRNCIRHAPD